MGAIMAALVAVVAFSALHWGLNCILVPADAPVTLCGVSADVVHGFLIQGTNLNGLKGI